MNLKYDMYSALRKEYTKVSRYLEKTSLDAV